MKISRYICAYIALLFTFININSCPTCIGNLQDESTPAFFSEDLYKQPQITAQNSTKQLEDLLEQDEEEKVNKNSIESE